MAVFSEELIRSLMRRFERLLHVMTTSRGRNRKKLFNFKFLTKVFLIMEGEYALSEMFECHRTRTVLRREDRRVGEICAELRGMVEEEGWNWEFFRNL